MRRVDRVLHMAKTLLLHPYRTFTLTELAGNAGAAKSSLSEDVSLVRESLETTLNGTIETITGAGGGVRFVVGTSPVTRDLLLQKWADRLADKSRVLPGGFLYMSDILGDPDVLDMSGRMFAARFCEMNVNVVVTVETKGIPLAVSTARYLHVPVVVVRRDHKVTEGPSLATHYVSGSERRIQTMTISKRALPERARALIVDDFMRAGGTAKAVQSLLAEFAVEVCGTAVFAATAEPIQKLMDTYFALLTIDSVAEGRDAIVHVTPW